MYLSRIVLTIDSAELGTETRLNRTPRTSPFSLSVRFLPTQSDRIFPSTCGRFTDESTPARACFVALSLSLFFLLSHAYVKLGNNAENSIDA